MKRRSLLTTLSLSALSTFPGCVGTGPEPCRGETWTGLGFEVGLTDIAYSEATGQWEGQCSISTTYSYVRGPNSDVGITEAGVALYSRDGHLIDIVELGDMTWDSVPNADRSEMECGGFKAGGLTRHGEFAVDSFPYFLGLWYERVRAGTVDFSDALEYDGEIPPSTPVRPSRWKRVDQGPSDRFPGLPEHTPALGAGVSKATLVSYGRGCPEHGRESWLERDIHCCQLGIHGRFTPANVRFVPGVERAARTENGSRLHVEIQMRNYRRPPDRECESPEVAYTVGVSVTGDLPDTVSVLHRDVEGRELSKTVLTSDW